MSRTFENPVAAYLAGYSEGSKATHDHYVELLGMMQMRREAPEPVLPQWYALRCVGGTVQVLHVSMENPRIMAGDGWSLSICSDTEAEAAGACAEEWY